MLIDFSGNEATILPEEGEEELWEPVPEFEDRYEISNFGRCRNIKTKRLLKLKEDKNGYMGVTLNKRYKAEDGTIKYGHYKSIHRLVCEVFNGPPIGDANICDHIDFCKCNNYYKNLRFISPSDSQYHRKPPRKMRVSMLSTPILLLDEDGNIIQRYESIREAHNETGLNERQIYCNITGTRKPFKIGRFIVEKIDNENFF